MCEVLHVGHLRHLLWLPPYVARSALILVVLRLHFRRHRHGGALGARVAVRPCHWTALRLEQHEQSIVELTELEVKEKKSRAEKRDVRRRPPDSLTENGPGCRGSPKKN